jgi:hypothetical protein
MYFCLLFRQNKSLYEERYCNYHNWHHWLPDRCICTHSETVTRRDISGRKHTNIAGNHVSRGELHKGYSCRKNTGAFVWYKGKWEFLLKNYATELKVAADSSGMAVGQNMIIHKHVKQPLFRSNSFQYRALCELEGKLCIIQSNESIRYSDFVDMLSQAGVKHALYLDMGGWNHSWYREYEDSALTYIHNHPHKNYTNWLTFYR